MLETEIIDTGSGVEPEKQQLLFIPFLGLRNRLGLIKKRNHTIGLGLAGSRSLTLAINGDIKIKESRKFLTVFAFKIPVEVDIPLDSDEFLNQDYTKVEQLKGNTRTIHPELKDYLIRKNLFESAKIDGIFEEAQA